jgi:hypothetical protein
MVDQVYSFVINSKDRIAGDINNATYNLMFSILPREYKYFKVGFTFRCNPAFFVDSYDTGGLIDIDYSSQTGYIRTSLLLQNSMKTDNSPSNVLGFWNRVISTQNSTTTNHICYVLADKSTNQDIVVLRPDVDQIKIEVLLGNSDTNYLVSTNSTGVVENDMPPYMLILQFTPVREFHVT